MDLATYFERSAPFCDHDPEMGLLSAYAHGLMAEVGEVLEELRVRHHGAELVHELGDCAWYIVQAARVTGLTARDLLRSRDYFNGPGHETERYFVSACAKVSGLLEKMHRHGRSEDPDLHGRLWVAIPAAWKALALLAHQYCHTPAGLLDANISKLSARYAKEEK